MPQYSVETLQARVDTARFTRWMGLTVREITDTAVHFSVDTREDMLGGIATGALHGGILASLIDTASSLALLSQTGGNCVTISLTTDFHRMAKPGELFITGNLIKRGSTISCAEARIYDQEQRLIASGRATLMTLQTTDTTQAN